MILHHVAQRACLLVERPAPFHAQRFSHGNLHVINVIPVPDWLEDSVGKAEHQNVLHRLFAQVVIDAEDLVFLEDRVDLAVQLARRLQVVAKRLFDHHRHLALLRLRHSLCAKVFDDRRKVLWRCRQIEKPPAAEAFLVCDAL